MNEQENNTAPAPERIPLDKLVRIYLKIKAATDDLTKKYEAELAVLETQGDGIKGAMKTQLQELGVNSVNTSFGTVIKGVKSRFYAQDWDAFKKFVKDNDALDLFEKRIAQGNMATFLADNPDKVPPGLNSQSEVTITVKKPTAK
jgi:hypothetical protein